MQRIKEKKHEIVYADEGIFGSGCVSENGAELKALGSRAMIVTGKHSSRINGSLAAVEQALQANGQTYVILMRSKRILLWRPWLWQRALR